MPAQEDHEKPENMVESPGKKTHSARSLEEAVDSNETLQGFYAMNQVENPEELERETSEMPEDEDREKGHPVP